MENNMGGVGEQQQRLALPPGFRFMPTDEELLTIYLRNQVDGQPPPHWFPIPIRDLYVTKGDPWVVQREVAFPYGEGSEFYCFTSRRRRGSGFLRSAGSGTWSAKGKDLEVKDKRTGDLLGHKLMLKFVPKEEGAGCGDEVERSNWIMHEYRLPNGLGGGRPASSKAAGAKQVQPMVLCKIHQRSSTKKGALASSSESAEASSSITSPL